jgi:hypothetical protein
MSHWNIMVRCTRLVLDILRILETVPQSPVLQELELNHASMDDRHMDATFYILCSSLKLAMFSTKALELGKDERLAVGTSAIRCAARRTDTIFSKSGVLQIPDNVG